MQTMTMKQGIPTTNPMTSASSFSVKQNDGDNGIQQIWANTEVDSFGARVISLPGLN